MTRHSLGIWIIALGSPSLAVGKCAWLDWRHRMVCEEASASAEPRVNALALPRKISGASTAVPYVRSRPPVAVVASMHSSNSTIFPSSQSTGRFMSCSGRLDGSSGLPSPSSASVAKATAPAAAAWWRCVVPSASKASPPSVGKATLFFVHVPKVRPELKGLRCRYLFNAYCFVLAVIPSSQGWWHEPGASIQ